MASRLLSGSNWCPLTGSVATRWISVGRTSWIAAAWPAGAPTVVAIDAPIVAPPVAPIRVVDPQAVQGPPAS